MIKNKIKTKRKKEEKKKKKIKRKKEKKTQLRQKGRKKEKKGVKEGGGDSVMLLNTVSTTCTHISSPQRRVSREREAWCYRRRP